MSTTTIEQHHERWSELPLFTHDRWIVTDDDTQAWGDIIYMRGLVEDIQAELRSADQAHDVLGGGERDGRGLIEFDIELYLEPWPVHDPAADLIAAWRDSAVAA